jgi:hypothetical protein
MPLVRDKLQKPQQKVIQDNKKNRIMIVKGITQITML